MAGSARISSFLRSDFDSKSGLHRVVAHTHYVATKFGRWIINAWIRIDDAGGFAYSSHMGFESNPAECGDSNAEGHVFNRVHKRLYLNDG